MAQDRISGDIKMSANYDAAARGLELYIWATDGRGRETHVAGPVEMHPIVEDVWHPPALHLKLEAANQLMDDLWRAGVRPTNVRNQSEIVDAKEKHIEDLRGIAAKLLDKVVGA